MKNPVYVDPGHADVLKAEAEYLDRRLLGVIRSAHARQRGLDDEEPLLREELFDVKERLWEAERVVKKGGGYAISRDNMGRPIAVSMADAFPAGFVDSRLGRHPSRTGGTSSWQRGEQVAMTGFRIARTKK